MATTLEARGLSKHFGNVVAVDAVDLVIGAGERVGLVGESGSGKSTLGRLLLRLDTPTSGTIHFDDADITRLTGRALLPFRRRAQVVFQDPASALNPRLTVLEIVAEGLVIHGLHAGQHAQRVTALLREVGLDDDVLHRLPHELSGGQKQRVGLARALAVEPTFLLLDEPVSALDVSVQAQIVNLLQDLSARLGLSMLFVAHDLHVVRHLCEHVAVMFRGRIIERGPTEAVFNNAQHPYTRALLAAVPVADPRRRHERTAPAKANDVDDSDIVDGCRYRVRCREALPQCATSVPALVQIGPGAQHVACHARVTTTR